MTVLLIAAGILVVVAILYRVSQNYYTRWLYLVILLGAFVTQAECGLRQTARSAIDIPALDAQYGLKSVGFSAWVEGAKAVQKGVDGHMILLGMIFLALFICAIPRKE